MFETSQRWWWSGARASSKKRRAANISFPSNGNNLIVAQKCVHKHKSIDGSFHDGGNHSPFVAKKKLSSLRRRLSFPEAIGARNEGNKAPSEGSNERKNYNNTRIFMLGSHQPEWGCRIMSRAHEVGDGGLTMVPYRGVTCHGLGQWLEYPSFDVTMVLSLKRSLHWIDNFRT